MLGHLKRAGMLIVILGALFLTPSLCFASDYPSLPSPSGMSYYFIFKDSANYYNVRYTSSPCFAFNTGGYTEFRTNTAGINYHYYYCLPNATNWTSSYNGTTSANAQCHGSDSNTTFITANYSILYGDGSVYYAPTSLTITNPVDGQTYTTKPGLDFSFTGYDSVSFGFNEGTPNDFGGVAHSSPYTLDASQIPLIKGVNTLKFYHGLMNDSNLIKTVTFTYSPTVSKSASITGITDSSTVQYLPNSFNTYHTVGYGRIQLLINGEVASTELQKNVEISSVQPTDKYVYYWKIGTNTIALKDIDSGVTIASISFVLVNFDTDGDNNIIKNNASSWDAGLGAPPVAPTDGDIFSWLKYIFDYILYFLNYIITGIGSVFQSVFDIITSLLSNIVQFSGVISQVFSGFPTLWISVISLSLVLGLLLKVVNR